METQDIQITANGRVIYMERVLELVEMQTTHKTPLTSKHDLEIRILCKIENGDLWAE